MTGEKRGSRCWRRFKGVLKVVLVVVAVHEAYKVLGPDPEIALIIGEPWEDMRARSSASIDPATHIGWYRKPPRDARLKFADAQYGFVTPKARIFTIDFKDQYVSSVRMSPLGGALPLDDALKVVLDLQEQWRAGGWHVLYPDKPAFEDTPAGRLELLKGSQDRVTFWQAGDKFQARLLTHRFRDDRHPDQDRFMITLHVRSVPVLPPSAYSERVWP